MLVHMHTQMHPLRTHIHACIHAHTNAYAFNRTHTQIERIDSNMDEALHHVDQVQRYKEGGGG
jgi:hypothetical protein